MDTHYIVVANTKGGVGKTTTAMMLGFALAKDSTVEVRDVDPQGSASEWADRASETAELPFTVTVANQRTVSKPSTAKWVIIDTPPGNAGTVEAALKIADFVIIPTQPAAMDIDRMWATLQVTEGMPRAVLLTKAFANTKALAAALSVLEANGVPQFETIIAKREAVAGAFGQTPGELAGYDQVADELVEVFA